jgi:hypothetical protein
MISGYFIHLLFIHLFFILLFLFFLSSPNLLVHDGGIHHASTIMSYVSIVVEFVTFNVVGGHINISFLNISSISSAIYNFMSKVITSKTITIKEALIPGSE